jgi:hypothetical protein
MLCPIPNLRDLGTVSLLSVWHSSARPLLLTLAERGEALFGDCAVANRDFGNDRRDHATKISSVKSTHLDSGRRIDLRLLYDHIQLNEFVSHNYQYIREMPLNHHDLRPWITKQTMVSHSLLIIPSSLRLSIDPSLVQAEHP